MTTINDIVVVSVGVPGPAGSGITSAQLTSINNQLAALNAGTAGGITVQNQGTSLSTLAETINFSGAGVTASGTTSVKTITIPGGSSNVIVVDEGGVQKVATLATLNFTDPDFAVGVSGNQANISLQGFNNAKPFYAQVFPNVAMGNPITASTTNTSTWVQAMTLSWTIPAGTYTLAMYGAAIFASNASGSGAQFRPMIGGTAGSSITSTMGLDNTTLQVAQARTGVVSNGSTPIVFELDFLSTSSSIAVNCYTPALFALAQRTA